MNGLVVSLRWVILLSLVVAGAHAEGDFGEQPFCFWSSDISIQQISLSRVNDTAVVKLDFVQYFELRTKSRVHLTSAQASEMRAKLTFKAQGEGVWKDLGGGMGMMTEGVEEANERVGEKHVLVRDTSSRNFQITVPDILRDADEKACHVRISGILSHELRPVPGCEMDLVRIKFDGLDASSGIRDSVYLNGNKSKLISREKGKNPETRSTAFVMDIYSNDITQCSLVKEGDFCQGVLSKKKELRYVDTDYIKNELSYCALFPTIYAILTILRDRKSGKSTSSPLMTILLSNIYGAILFCVSMFLLAPAHNHATFYLCDTLWQPTYLSAIGRIMFYIYQPFVTYGPILGVISSVAVKAGYLKRNTMLQLMLIIFTTSAMYQLWFGHYWFVIHRNKGQGFKLVSGIIIMQTLLTYELGSRLED